jgi:hypothetical protein
MSTDTEHCDNGCYVLINIISANDIDPTMVGERNLTIPYRFTITPKIIPNSMTLDKSPPVQILMNEFVIGNIQAEQKTLYEFYQVFLPFESDYVEIDWQADKPSMFINVGIIKPTVEKADFRITPKDKKIFRLDKSAILPIAQRQDIVKVEGSIRFLTLTIGIYTEKVDTMFTSLYAFKIFMPPMGDVIEDDKKTRMALELMHIRSDQKVQCDPIGIEGFYSCLFAVIFDSSDKDSSLVVYPRTADDSENLAFVGELVDVEPIEKNDIQYIIDNMPNPRDVYNSLNNTKHIFIDKIDITKCLYLMVICNEPKIIEVMTSTFSSQEYIKPNPSSPQLIAIRPGKQIYLNFETTQDFLINIVNVAGGGYIYWDEEKDDIHAKTPCSLNGYGDRITMTSYTSKEDYKLSSLVFKNNDFAYFTDNSTEFIFYITYYPRNSLYSFDQLKAGRSTEFNYRETKFPLSFFVPIVDNQISVSLSFYDLYIKQEKDIHYDGPMFKIWGKVIKLDEAYEARTDQSKKPTKDSNSKDGVFDGVFGNLYLSSEDIKKYGLKPEDEPTLFFTIEQSDSMKDYNITGAGVEIGIYKELADSDYKPYISENDYHTGKLVPSETNKNGMTALKLRVNDVRPYILIEFAANSNDVSYVIGPYLEIEKNKNYISNIETRRINGRTNILFKVPNDMLYMDKPLYFIAYLNTVQTSSHLGNFVFKYMSNKEKDGFISYVNEKSGITYEAKTVDDGTSYTLNFTGLLSSEYIVKAVYEDSLIEGEIKDTIALSESKGKYYHYYDLKPDTYGKISITLDDPGKKISYIKVMTKINFEITNEFLLYEPVIVGNQQQREDPSGIETVEPKEGINEVKYYKNNQMGLGKFTKAKKVQKIKLVYDKPEDISNYIKIEVKSPANPVLYFWTVDTTGKETRQQLAEETSANTYSLWIKKEQLEGYPYIYTNVEFAKEGAEFQIRFYGYQFIEVEKSTFQYNYYVSNRNKEMEFKVKNDYISSGKGYLTIYASGSKKINIKLNNCEGPQCEQNTFTNGAAIVIELPKNNFFDFIVTGEEGDFISVGSKVTIQDSQIHQVELTPNNYPMPGLLIKNLLEKECYKLPTKEKIEYFISGIFYNRIAEIILLDEQGNEIPNSSFIIKNGYLSQIYTTEFKYRYMCVSIPRDKQKYKVEKVPYSIQMTSQGSVLNAESNPYIHQLSGLIYPRYLDENNYMLFNLISTQSKSSEIIYNMITVYGAPKMYIYKCKNYPLCDINLDNIDTNENFTKVHELNHISTWRNLDTNLNSVIDSSQYIMVVKCQGVKDAASGSCIFKTSMFGNNDTVSLVEGEQFSQYILKGEPEEYIIDFANEVGIKKVYIDTSVISGDVTFNIKNNYKEDEIIAHKYYLANKVFYSITLKENTTVSQLTIKLEAKANSYYTIEYRLIRDESEMEINSISTGINYLVPLPKNKNTGDSQKILKIVPIRIFKKDTYFINFNSLNCRFKIEKFNPQDGQYHENFKMAGDYGQDVIKVTDDSTIENQLTYRITVTEKDYSEYQDNMCMLYVSGVEIMPVNSPVEKEILIGEGIPQRVLFENEMQKIRYIYPIVDLVKNVTVDIRSITPANFTIKTSFNNKGEETLDASRSTTIFVNEEQITRYCQKNDVCGIIVEIFVQPSANMPPVFETSIKQVKNSPYYLTKNIIRRDFLAGDSSLYMFTDLGLNDEGYLTVDFTRSSGYIYGKIVKQNAEPLSNSDWRQFTFPKTKEDSLYYEFNSKKLLFSKLETSVCEKGCYLLIHIKSSMQGDFMEQYRFFPFTISVVLASNKNIERIGPKIRVEPEEFVVGTLTNFNIVQDNDMYEYYQTIIPFEADKIEVDLQSDAGVMLIKVGDKRPTKTDYDFILRNNKSDTMFELDKNKILNIVKTQTQTDAKLTFTLLTIAMYAEDCDSIVGTRYSFQMHFSQKINIIKVDQDQKTLCKPQLDTKENNYYCLFMITYTDYDFINDVLVYAKSQDLSATTYMYGDHIPCALYDQNNVEELQKIIPTSSSKYNTLKNHVGYIFSTVAEANTHMFVKVMSDKPDTIELLTSFHTFEKEISPDPSSTQLFSMNPSQQEIKLNFVTSKAIYISLVSLYGHAKITLNDKYDVEYTLRGRDDRLSLAIPHIEGANQIITIKNVNYKRPEDEVTLRQEEYEEDDKPGFAFYIDYTVRNFDSNFDEAVLGKTTEIIYPQGDFPLLFFTKIDDYKHDVNIFFTFHDLELEDRTKWNRKIADNELIVNAGILPMKEVYSVKNDPDKRPDAYIPKPELILYDPSTQSGQITFSAKAFQDSKIKPEERPAVYFSIEKANWNLVKFKKIRVEMTVLQENSDSFITEKLYQYGKLPNVDAINSYKLRVDNTTGDMRIQFSSNNKYVDYAINTRPNERTNMTLEAKIEKNERGKSFITFKKPTKGGKDIGFIYLNVFFKNPKSISQQTGNYVFKYINTENRNYLKEYPIKENAEIKYTKSQPSSSNNVNLTATFNRIDKINLNIIYSLKVIYSNSYSETFDTISLTDSKKIVTKLENPSDDTLQMTLTDIASDFTAIQVVAQIRDGPITEYVAYKSLVVGSVKPDTPPTPKPTDKQTEAEESSDSGIYIVVAVSITLLVVVIVLVIIVMVYNAKNKNLLNEVNKVTFVAENKNSNNLLIDPKNELE